MYFWQHFIRYKVHCYMQWTLLYFLFCPILSHVFQNAIREFCIPLTDDKGQYEKY